MKGWYNTDKDERKEYTEKLKQGAKELIDGIGTDTEIEQKVIKLIYGFAKRGFLECRAQRGEFGSRRIEKYGL